VRRRHRRHQLRLPGAEVTKTEGGSACLRDVDRCEAIMKAVVDAVDAR